MRRNGWSSRSAPWPTIPSSSGGRRASRAVGASRSMAACQGALLLVDATKGVQAQTVANFFLAFEQELSITPVVNKVDLSHANVDGALAQERERAASLERYKLSYATLT